MTDIDLTAAIRPTSDAIYRQLSGQYGDFSTPSDEEAEAVLKAALPHILAQVEARVKPTREDVARVIESDAWTLSDDDYFEAYDDGMRGVGYCLQMRSGRRKASLKRADAVLALLPGRTEAEVRGEALQEVAEQFFIPSQGLGHYLAVDFAETLGREFLRGYAERIARGGERG